MTLIFKKHNGPTPADDIAPQIITDCGNLTLEFSTLLPDSRTLVSKLNTKLALIWKEDFGPLGNSPVLLLLSPGKTTLMTTVAKFLHTSVCGGSWCLDPSHIPFLSKFTQILESILLDNHHKAVVLSVGCASFYSTLFPSTQLFCWHAWIQNSVNSQLLWQLMFVAYPLCEVCQWLSRRQSLTHFTKRVKSVNDCLLDKCQISSLPHDCVA